MRTRIVALAAVSAALGASVALTVQMGLSRTGSPVPQGIAVQVSADNPVTLVAYQSCEETLDALRAAILPEVGAYGIGVRDLRVAVPDVAAPREGAAVASGSAKDVASPQDTGFSGTTVHEAGVDEPDLVKTDGHRIVTVADGALRVVDVATRQQTAMVSLPGEFDQLLLAGDRVLLLGRGGAPDQPDGAGSTLLLVDLAGGARVVGSLAVDGGYLDARQLGTVARVVIRSQPRLQFVQPQGALTESVAAQRNRDTVRHSSIADWMPRYRLTVGGHTSSGQLVDCRWMSHPADYTATSMLSVLTIDLAHELGTGDPVSIVADGDTVYGTGTSLFVADDHPTPGCGGVRCPARPGVGAAHTQLYQFDVSGSGRPVFVASGQVDGTLLNQYSMSEHDGVLRVATTAGAQSSVVTLTRHGDRLTTLGRVDGLGKGERIYAVRFIGTIGYVVTFRQLDPLYTVDLTDPAHPRVAGELTMTGYSAYLHPVGEGRLLGVGQSATDRGRATGTQVSLFDTGSPATPRLLARVSLPDTHSLAESDPHAFLYWPDTGLVVLPAYGDADKGAGSTLVLRLAGEQLSQVGRLDQPTPEPVERAVVAGGLLWTVSRAGLAVSTLDTLARTAWLPFS